MATMDVKLEGQVPVPQARSLKPLKPGLIPQSGGATRPPATPHGSAGAASSGPGMNIQVLWPTCTLKISFGPTPFIHQQEKLPSLSLSLLAVLSLFSARSLFPICCLLVLQPHSEHISPWLDPSPLTTSCFFDPDACDCT